MQIRLSNVLKTGILAVVVIIVVGIIGMLLGYRMILNHLAESAKRIEAVAENIVITRVQENNALLKKRISETDERILQLVESRDMQIMEIGSAVVDLKQTVQKWIESDHRYSKGSENDHEFVKIYQKASDGGEYPIAWAMYYPNRPGEKWKTGTYPLQINSRIILTDGAEKDAVINIWAENNQMKETRGNKYPLKLGDVEWVRREIRDKKFSFNTRLGLGITAEITEVYPTLDLSFFSYGRTSRDLDWRILSVGIGMADLLSIDLSPIEYNAGNAIPLIENLFFGPSVRINAMGQYGFGLKTSVLF